MYGNPGDIKHTSPHLPAETHTNVAYGEDPKQQLDIYLPAGRDTVNTKIMILLHGGGWVRGDKAEYNAYITALQERLPGYAFANINYRLYDNGVHRFPDQENDIKAAVEFLLSKRADYGFSKKIVLMGASAGAHLALLQGYKNMDNNRPLAIISFFGPSNLELLFKEPAHPATPLLLSGIVGGTPDRNGDAYKSSSPINFVTGQSPPTFLLHGDADNLVPVVQSKLLKEKLKKAGVKTDLVIYPDAGHGWRGRNLEDSFDKVKAFLDVNVK